MKLLDTLKTNFIFTAALLVLFAIASPAAAQDTTDTTKQTQNTEFSSWDENGDGMLDQDEFMSGISEMGPYDEWDSDKNGEISEEEWTTGTEEKLSNYDAGGFSEWDKDGNGNLSEDEFGDGLFDTLDENDDDYLDQNEFNSWYEEQGLF